jgi:hypothetical protein
MMVAAKDLLFQGHSAKNWESGIFGTHFLKMQTLRFHDLIAKIGITKIGIAKIGIPILAIHPHPFDLVRSLGRRK